MYRLRNVPVMTGSTKNDYVILEAAQAVLKLTEEMRRQVHEVKLKY